MIFDARTQGLVSGFDTFTRMLVTPSCTWPAAVNTEVGHRSPHREVLQ
jgi:hypothetical protein